MTSWHRGRPRGHNLKSLASKFNFLALASKPASTQKFSVLDSKTALYFDALRMGQGHDQICFVLKKRQRACTKIFEDSFFPGERLNFPKNLRIVE